MQKEWVQRYGLLVGLLVFVFVLSYLQQNQPSGNVVYRSESRTSDEDTSLSYADTFQQQSFDDNQQSPSGDDIYYFEDGDFEGNCDPLETIDRYSCPESQKTTCTALMNIKEKQTWCESNKAKDLLTRCETLAKKQVLDRCANVRWSCPDTVPEQRYHCTEQGVTSSITASSCMETQNRIPDGYQTKTNTDTGQTYKEPVYKTDMSVVISCTAECERRCYKQPLSVGVH